MDHTSFNQTGFDRTGFDAMDYDRGFEPERRPDARRPSLKEVSEQAGWEEAPAPGRKRRRLLPSQARDVAAEARSLLAGGRELLSEGRGLVDSIRERIQAELQEPPFQRDPEYIARQLPTLEKIVSYFRPQVTGFQHLPDQGPFLMVGNHCGGMYTPELYVFATAWIRERGIDDPTYALAHNLLFASPLRGFFRKMGGLPASMGNAEKAFDQGASVMVYPGGDFEAFRPWWHRNRVDFGNRKGFVKLALRRGVPVVPVVSHGSHETTFVVARGDRLARMMGLERVNVKIFPFILGFPWGVIPGWFPHLPMPSRIRIELGQPLDWSHYGPDAADDPVVVQRCYDEIIAVMQARLDRMVRERPYPLFS